MSEVEIAFRIKGTVPVENQRKIEDAIREILPPSLYEISGYRFRNVQVIDQYSRG